MCPALHTNNTSNFFNETSHAEFGGRGEATAKADSTVGNRHPAAALLPASDAVAVRIEVLHWLGRRLRATAVYTEWVVVTVQL